jgi:hypothetical protein
VGMIMVQGRRFKSPPGHLIQRKFSMKIKNSIIYGPTTTACTPNHLIPTELG